MTELISIDDYEAAAAAMLPAGTHGYFAGGATGERTLRDNVAAWARIRFRPRVLVDVSATSARTTLLGSPISLPVVIAPMALQRMAHPDGEVGMARAAASAGTIMTLSTLASSSPGEVAAAAPGSPRWYQMYVTRDRGVSQALLEQAVAAGFTAVAITVDAPVPGRRERDHRTGFRVPAGLRIPAVEAALGRSEGVTVEEFFSIVESRLTWSDLDQFISRSPLPVLVKGIQTAEDARLAAEHGAGAVVVSNHGGRQLDGALATAEVLPQVLDAVGDSMEVLVDGGIRRGTDVAAALALGARAVMVGRPLLWGLAVDGSAGAERVLDILRDELVNALSLLGCTGPDDLRRSHIVTAAR